MKSRLLHQTNGLRTFAVVMDKGDEALGELTQFACENHSTGASLTAVGACREATLAYFDPGTLGYEDIPVDQQAEVLSLLGDIAELDGQPAPHAHAVLGLRDGSTVGGHLRRARPPIEPPFATVRHLTEITRSAGSRARPGPRSRSAVHHGQHQPRLPR